MAMDPEAARGLLLGLFGLRRGLVEKDSLLEVLEGWLADPSQDLGTLLVAQGALDGDGHALLLRLVSEQLGEGSAGDPQRTVAYSGPTPGGTRPASLPSHPVSDGSRESGVPRYKILRLHARGGLGEVFLAVDPHLKRQVALKKMRPEMAGDSVSESRFLLEAELTAGLEHPGIVPVHELSRDGDGRPYYIMRFVEGETLKAAVARYHATSSKRLGPRERERAFRRLLQSLVAACNAVAYAHSRGVVHRDLKPDNIMLGPFGETLVLDWGIAKPSGDLPAEGDEPWTTAPVGDDGAGLTRPGAAIGTPRYMSPEQAAGTLDEVGPASDVYGLGATLYFLLTGRSPFPDGSLAEILDRVRRGVFPAPRSIDRTIDPVLEATCLTAMSPRPEDRHPSALALGEEIEAWLADVRFRGEQAEALNQVRATLARLGIERAHHLFRRDCHDQGMLWLARALESATESEPWLERAVRLSLGSWFARSRLLERSISEGGEVLAVAFSPDGHRLATGASGASARLWDAATGNPLGSPLAHGSAVTSVAFTRDGRWVVTAGREGGMRLWDALSGSPGTMILTRTAPIRAICFSPDGALMAFAGLASEPSLWRVATGEALQEPDGGDVRIQAVAFAASGRLLATAREDGRVEFWDAASGHRLGPDLDHGAPIAAMTLGPDGRELLTGGVDGRARIWSMDDRSLTRELSMPAGICQADWCPARNVIALASEDGSARLWNPVRGQPVGDPLAHEAKIECLKFGPDGALLATGGRDGTVRLWETGTGLPIGPPLSHRGSVMALAFSPDGRRLATGCSDGIARIWRVALRMPGDLERLACWVRVHTGLDFDEADAICKLDPTTGWELQRRLHELGGPPPRRIEKW